MLCRLIYSSNAIPSLSYLDLRDIMEKSMNNNAPVGITGMLCFGNYRFLQILEGERKIVNQTYNRIYNDKRHFNTEIIELTEIETRLFSDWSMKFIQLAEFSAEQVKSLTIKYSSSPEFTPSSMTAKQCLNFMIDFSKVI